MIHYMYQALTSPLGICLRTSDGEAARQKLYAARREAADPALAALGICLSPTDKDEVWIVKKGSPQEKLLLTEIES